MAVVIRDSPAEIARHGAICRSIDGVAIDRSFGIGVNDPIRQVWSAEFKAKLAEYQYQAGTTLPSAEVRGTFPVRVPHLEARLRRSEEDFETAFDRLGSWSGPYSSRNAVASELEFWKSSGREGASWLIQKIRLKDGNDTLNAVANVLANLGTDGLSTILGYLHGRPTPDQAYCLLDAMGRMGRQKEEVADRGVEAIARYIDEQDLDLRLAAVSATSILSPTNALELLRSSLAIETDPTVAAAIRDEIEERVTE